MAAARRSALSFSGGQWSVCRVNDATGRPAAWANETSRWIDVRLPALRALLSTAESRCASIRTIPSPTGESCSPAAHEPAMNCCGAIPSQRISASSPSASASTACSNRLMVDAATPTCCASAAQVSCRAHPLPIDGSVQLVESEEWWRAGARVRSHRGRWSSLALAAGAARGDDVHRHRHGSIREGHQRLLVAERRVEAHRLDAFQQHARRRGGRVGS